MSQSCQLYVATVTPFDTVDRVDLGVVRAHAQWLVSRGVRGICPVGTTGEFLYMTLQEKARVIQQTVEAVRGKVQVVAGVWALRPREVSFLCHVAEDAGADAVFMPPPIYYPADDEAMLEWYEVAQFATELPVYAYNIPAYAANTISRAALVNMLDAGVVSGVKDSSGKEDRLQELLEVFDGRGPVFAASDSFATKASEMGAYGFISALANAWPGAFSKLLAGDTSLQPAVDAARNLVKANGGLPALKYIVAKRGFAAGAARLPGQLSHKGMEEIDAFLQSAHAEELTD